MAGFFFKFLYVRAGRGDRLSTIFIGKNGGGGVPFCDFHRLWDELCKILVNNGLCNYNNIMNRLA